MPLPIPPFIPFDARDKFYNAKEGIYRFKNAELEGVARLHRYNDTCLNSHHTRAFVHASEIPPRLKVGSYARLDAVDEKLCNVGGKLSKKKDLGSTKEKLANSMCRTNRRIDKTLHDAENEIYWVKTGVKMSEYVYHNFFGCCRLPLAIEKTNIGDTL